MLNVTLLSVAAPYFWLKPEIAQSKFQQKIILFFKSLLPKMATLSAA
jgi:hypothetical protein